MSNEEKLQTRIEELQGQLQQSDKLASLGVLSAGIAHEIQNPLNFVINFSQMSNDMVDDLEDLFDDKVQRVLYLMSNACTQNAQRC